MVERAWFGNQLAQQGNGIVGLGAVATIAEHGIALRAFDERRDSRTDFLNHSCEVASGNRQCASTSRRGLIALVPFQLVGDDPRRVATPQHFSRTWSSLCHVFIDQFNSTTPPPE